MGPIYNSTLIFDFNSNTDIDDWVIVDDGVMGGESKGSISLDSLGHGKFSGHVSLENYGGFSSTRHKFEKINVLEKSKITLILKGDGKDYQFRIKANSSDYYSYIMPIYTTGEWERITIELQAMYPTYRGRKLDFPNFDQDNIEEIIFLIGNKKNENFELLIDKVILE